jgi:hypothetical protein
VPIDPDEMIRSLRRVSETLRVSAELEAAAVTAQPDCGEVTVRVNSAGGLADLLFHPESDKLSRDDLARLVLATSRRAQARLAQQVSTTLSGMYGRSSDTATFITDAYAGRYPAIEDSEEQRCGPRVSDPGPACTRGLAPRARGRIVRLGEVAAHGRFRGQGSPSEDALRSRLLKDFDVSSCGE